MENNVYVVWFEAEESVYSDMDAVFSSMEKAKTYVATEITRLKGFDIKPKYDTPDYYEVEFTNTYAINTTTVYEMVCARIQCHEIDIELK